MVDVPVNEQVPSIVVDVVTNGQVAFGYPFRADDVGDLRAQYRPTIGSAVDLVGGVDFTASGLGTATGGVITVTTLPAMVAGSKLAIYRDIAIKRTTDFSRDLFAADLNREQDTTYMILQQLQRDLARSFKVAVGVTPPDVAAVFQASVDALAAAAAAIGASGSQFRFYNRAAMVAASVPLIVNHVSVAGFYSPLGGGGHALQRISTPSSPQAWHVQIADGSWWQIAEEEVTPQMFGAKADFVWATKTGTDDAAAIQAAFSYGKKVKVPKGLYRIHQTEIEQVTVGQVVEFENTGGYGYGEDIGANWQNNTAFVGTGTFPKRVRTRRNFRGSAGDAQDAALSVVLNIQAENVHLIRPCVRLWCDYSNLSPTNFGDDCDVAIFVGCRTGVQIKDPVVTDYFRKVGIYLDATHATNLARHLDKSGVPYQNALNISGGDGTHIWNPYIRGPRVGVGVIGAKPKVGASTYGDPYYDQQLGATASDFRGTFGFSDFDVFGGRIYGPDHHSNRRLADPTPSGGVLNTTSLAAEPDFMPAALWIDGMSANASGGAWGINLEGTRVATFEAFRVRLGRASRFRLIGGHIEGRNGGRMNVAGTVIDTNDYTLNTYGDICGVAGLTGNAMWIGSVRQSNTDGAFNHFYGDNARLDTDSGRIFPGDYISSRLAKDLDLRTVAGQVIRGRVDASTAFTVSLAELMLVGGRIRMGPASDDPVLIVGSGIPEGSVSAPPNSLYINKTASGVATWMYRKSTGTGTSGWVAASN